VSSIAPQVRELVERFDHRALPTPVVQRQIDTTDRQPDQLVYELYGLTDDEIRIVEEATER